MTNYQESKVELKRLSKEVKAEFKDDKPAIRMYINDYADYLCKKYQFSEYYRDLLSNYTCSLHPKK